MFVKKSVLSMKKKFKIKGTEKKKKKKKKGETCISYDLCGLSNGK